MYDEDSLILSKQQEETEHGVATYTRREASFVVDQTFYVDPGGWALPTSTAALM